MDSLNNPKTTKILHMICSNPNSIKFLFHDGGGFAIRTLYMDGNGNGKSRTIPVTTEELNNLAEYVQSHQFQKADQWLK